MINYAEYCIRHDKGTMLNIWTGENSVKEQFIYKFPNGYGASVIRFPGTYGYSEGLWELAVIKFSDNNDCDDFELVYDTPITDDVLGFLDVDDVSEVLNDIFRL